MLKSRSRESESEIFESLESGVGVGNFGKVGVGVGHYPSDSTTLGLFQIGGRVERLQRLFGGYG